jgi:uncharacterized protein YndB with AHSA1/START domain
MTLMNNPSSARELVINRTFDAPRALVFKVWTDPQHLAQWWGPSGYTNPVCEVDLRPGGALYIEMTGPDGVMIPNKGIFREVIPPERLVFTTFAFEDEQGNPQLEVLNTVTFTENNGKTQLTLRAVVMQATMEVAVPLSGMEQGWNESLDRLAEELTHA